MKGVFWARPSPFPGSVRANFADLSGLTIVKGSPVIANGRLGDPTDYAAGGTSEVLYSTNPPTPDHSVSTTWDSNWAINSNAWFFHYLRASTDGLTGYQVAFFRTNVYLWKSGNMVYQTTLICSQGANMVTSRVVSSTTDKKYFSWRLIAFVLRRSFTLPRR